MKITAVLWGRTNDANSIGPLESTYGDATAWTSKVQDNSLEYLFILSNNTGLYMTLYEGDVPADAPWDGSYQAIDEAYVDPNWPAVKDIKIAARLAGVKPEDVILRYA